MNTIIKDITEAEFYLQLQALQSEVHLFKDMGFDILAKQAEQRLEELKSFSVKDNHEQCLH